MPPFNTLPPHRDVFRAASNLTWIDAKNGRFLPDAFKLRERDLGSGVSVIVSPECPTLEEAARLSHRDRVRAVCRINVGQARGLGLGLDIVQDGDYHASITGLPFPNDENDLAALQKVNDYAHALSEISRICALQDIAPIA